MLADESDDALREMAFGRVSSPAEAASARAELSRRAGGDDPAEAERPEHSARPTAEAPSSETPDVSEPARGRRLLPFVATALASAVLGGAAVAAYGAGQVPPNAPSTTASAAPSGSHSVTSTSTVVTDSGTGEVVYEIPNRTVTSSGAAELWLSRGVGVDNTPLPPHLEDLQLTRFRYVGQSGDLSGIWAARDAGGDYCLVLQSRIYGGSTTGCVPETDFTKGGVYLGADGDSVLWNESSLIVSTPTRG